MSKKLSLEEIKAKVTALHNSNINIDWTDCIDKTSRVLCTCKICGKVWTPKVKYLYQGHGCGKCRYNKIRISNQEVQKRIYDVWKDTLTVNVQNYENTRRSKIQCICNICEHQWSTRPQVLIRGSGCPVCASVKRIKPFQKVFQEVQKVHKGTMLLNESTYNSVTKKAVFTCKTCGHSWQQLPRVVINGCGCPLCAMSKYQDKVKKILTDLKVPFVFDRGIGNCVNPQSGRLLRFDFILSNPNNCKMLIQVDGKQHFIQMRETIPIQKYKMRDSIKNNYAKAHGIVLIRVAGKRFGTVKHITIEHLQTLLKENTKDGVVDIESFRSYDFNRE